MKVAGRMAGETKPWPIFTEIVCVCVGGGGSGCIQGFALKVWTESLGFWTGRGPSHTGIVAKPQPPKPVPAAVKPSEPVAVPKWVPGSSFPKGKAAPKAAPTTAKTAPAAAPAAASSSSSSASSSS
eukprot:COSAG04_NODE_7_length_45988_cov_220.188869_8_plen_126_part_00